VHVRVEDAVGRQVARGEGERDIELRVLEVHQQAERPHVVVGFVEVEPLEPSDVLDARVALAQAGLGELAARLLDDLGPYVDAGVVVGGEEADQRQPAAQRSAAEVEQAVVR
jgi:hypothetical protein